MRPILGPTRALDFPTRAALRSTEPAPPAPTPFQAPRMARAALAAGLVLALSQTAAGQPRLTSVMPCGGRVGGATVVEVRGANLGDAAAVRFAHPGLTGRVLAPAKSDPKAKDPPVRVEVTLAPDLPPGAYDLRLVGPRGVSNPRRFLACDLECRSEREPNDDAAAPEPLRAVVGCALGQPTEACPLAERVELESVLFGTLGTPTDVDYAVLHLEQGESAWAEVLATGVESRARPLLEVFGPGGVRLARSHNDRGTDAWVGFTAPEAGDYFVRISELAAVQGGPDSTYRLTVSANPPPALDPVAASGTSGWHGKRFPAPATPQGRVRLLAGLPRQFGRDFVALPGPGGPRALAWVKSALALEDPASHDSRQTATRLGFPVTVAGRLSDEAERDFYRIDAPPGEVCVVELVSERLGQRTDLALRVTDPAGDRLAPDADDSAEFLHPVLFPNRTTDPPAVFVTPKKPGGIVVGVVPLDPAQSHGERAGYLLEARRPAPDFRLVAMARTRQNPQALSVEPGGSTTIEVFAERRDRFAGAIALTIEGLPPGVTAAPAVLGRGAKQASVVLTADGGAAPGLWPLRVVGEATISGAVARRAADVAGLVWPVVRLEEELLLAVLKTPPKPAAAVAIDWAKLAPDEPLILAPDLERVLTLAPGEKRAVAVNLSPRPHAVELGLEPTLPSAPNAAPFAAGVAAVPATQSGGTLALEARPGAAPGLYTLAVRAEPAERNRPGAPAFAALQVRVRPRDLGAVALSLPANAKLAPGSAHAVAVRLDPAVAAWAGAPSLRLPGPVAGVTLAGGKLALALDLGAGPHTVPVEVSAVVDGEAVRSVAPLSFTVTNPPPARKLP